MWCGLVGRRERGEGRVYAYCGRTELDGFEGVFDLEEAAFGGECAVVGASVSMDDAEGFGGRRVAYLMPRSGDILSISNSDVNCVEGNAGGAYTVFRPRYKHLGVGVIARICFESKGAQAGKGFKRPQRWGGKLMYCSMLFLVALRLRLRNERAT